MDSRDSPLSQSAAVNRDLQPLPSSSSGAVGVGVGVGAGEDDALISVAVLAKDAYFHFLSRRFTECLDVLHQLAQKKEDDPKIMHNIAIAEYFRDGCANPKKLLEVLKTVEKKSEELGRTSGQQVEAGGNTENKSILESKQMSHQLSAASSETLVYMDEFDPAVATLNIAIIWFHFHEYAKALSVLEPLYDNIEPLEEKTALHVCLLLMDVALACQDESKSANVLLYLEKAFGQGSAGQADNGSQQSANVVAKSSSVPNSSSAGDSSNSDLAPSVNSFENSLSRTLSLSEETLEYETMLLDISGQNLARPTGLSSPNDLSRILTDNSSSIVDMKVKLPLYKVRFLLLTRNLKQAKREVKLTMNIARGRESSTALLVKSELEYARGNYRKSIKLLMASSDRTETGISSMFNNLGCIYYQLGKYHTASVLFSKALSSSSSLRKDKPRKLLTFLQDKSLLVLYNCGVQQLACGKPLLAARCFQKASLVFYNRPILWLRLAECCLMAIWKGLIGASRTPSDKSEIKVHVVGKGKWRHLAIENGIQRNGYMDSVEMEDAHLVSDGQPKLSLSFARQCLVNALHLLNFSELNHLKAGLASDLSLGENEIVEAESVKNLNLKNLSSLDSKPSTVSAGLGQVNPNGDSREQKGGTSQEIFQMSISCYKDIRLKENMIIKQAVLANLAYVELELENPERALSTAMSLLEVSGSSGIYIFLSYVYAAEALCLLNKPNEAVGQLSVYLSEGKNIELPFSQECDKWRVEKTSDGEETDGGLVAGRNPSTEESQGIKFLNPEEARGTLYANFATTYAMQGEFERAHHFAAQALSLIPDSPETIMTAVLVDLMLGNSQTAIAKLKHYGRVRFLPSGVQSYKS